MALFYNGIKHDIIHLKYTQEKQKDKNLIAKKLAMEIINYGTESYEEIVKFGKEFSYQ